MNSCSLHVKPKALWGCQRSSLASSRQASGAPLFQSTCSGPSALAALSDHPLRGSELSGLQASSSGRASVCTHATGAAMSPSGKWLGPSRELSRAGTGLIHSTALLTHLVFKYRHDPACTADDTDSVPRQYGVELTADQWQPWDPLDLSPQYLAVCFHVALHGKPT